MSVMTARALRPVADLDESVPRLIADENGALLYINPAFEALSGVSAAGGRLSLIDLLHFDNPDAAFRGPIVSGQAWLSALQGGAHDVYFEGSGLNASLQFDWVTLPDARRVLIASSDKAAPSAENVTRWLHQTPQKQSSFDEGTFLALSRDAMIVLDDLGTVIESNAALAALLGTDHIEGMAFLDLVRESDRASIRTLLNDIARDTGGGVFEFDCALTGNGGRLVHIEWTSRKTERYITALGRDVTALKNTRNTLTRQQSQLQEAEAIGHMGHWYWQLGQDDIVFSDELYRIFGTDAARFAPTLDAVNRFVHRRDIGRMMRAFQRAIIEQNDHDIDFRIRRENGSIAHVRCRGRCKLDSDGFVVALFGIMQDISDRIEHENNLRQAKDAAERAYAAKSQFLANMSHELRTPLNAIIGFSEILERQMFGPLGNTKYVDYTKGIRESGEHLLDLITDILDMSKIEAGQYKLALERVAMDKILHTAVHMMEGRALEKGIKIHLDVAPQIRPLVADRRAMMQGALNLLSNAVKFSHANGTVRVQYKEYADYAVLRVTDEGIGIPASKLADIGRPFEQVSNQYNRGHEGSGLGLAITKELMELHGGALQIDSVWGKGTTVTIRVPFEAQPASVH